MNQNLIRKFHKIKIIIQLPFPITKANKIKNSILSFQKEKNMGGNINLLPSSSSSSSQSMKDELIRFMKEIGGGSGGNSGGNSGSLSSVAPFSFSK